LDHKVSRVKNVWETLLHLGHCVLLIDCLAPFTTYFSYIGWAAMIWD